MNTQIADVKRSLSYLGFALILGIGSTREFSNTITDLLFYGALIMAVLAIYTASNIHSLFDEEEE